MSKCNELFEFFMTRISSQFIISISSTGNDKKNQLIFYKWKNLLKSVFCILPKISIVNPMNFIIITSTWATLTMCRRRNTFQFYLFPSGSSHCVFQHPSKLPPRPEPEAIKTKILMKSRRSTRITEAKFVSQKSQTHLQLNSFYSLSFPPSHFGHFLALTRNFVVYRELSHCRCCTSHSFYCRAIAQMDCPTWSDIKNNLEQKFFKLIYWRFMAMKTTNRKEKENLVTSCKRTFNSQLRLIHGSEMVKNCVAVW